MAKARDTLLPQFDPIDGGLADRRSATKFPNPPRLALLLLDYRINQTSTALSGVLNTLDAMVFGGIHDQVGGGFRRYSTAPSWSIPHFEKMLYDNAQLLQLYTEAFRITGLPLYRQLALETGAFSTTSDERDLLIPIVDDGDAETPSGTSLAIDLLLRLHEASAERRYLDAVTSAITRLSGQFQDHPESWAASVATLNRHRLPLGSASATATNRPPTPNATEGIHVPVTADHVGATASAISVPDEDEVLVTIKVDDKFHINANPASFDFLIPTTVEFKGVKPRKVEYPKPTRFTPEFARDGLDVYEGSVAVVARFPMGTLSGNGAIQGAVTAQACTNQICLPPSTLPISAAVDAK